VIAQSHVENSPARQLWQADQRAADVAAGRVDQATHVMVRDPNTGEITARPRTASDGAPDPAVPGNQQPPGPGEPQLRLERTADGRFVLAEGMEPMTDSQLRDLVAHKAQTDSQKLSTPQPGAYELKFNDDFILPQGVEWKWNEADPLLATVREFAAANNMSQATFSKLLGMHAASQMRDMQEFAAAKAAEVQKLGDTANARVDAIKTWLKAMGGEHFNDLARVLDMAPTAATVRGLETLMQRHVSQGSASWSGANREPSIPGKISDAEYSKLSYGERIEYASRFPQPSAR
jgi:hypothetical protein